VVEATVTGWFKRLKSGPKPEFGLALESVKDIKVKPLPRGLQEPRKTGRPAPPES